MSWLTSLPVWAILFLSLLIVGSVSSASYLILHKKTGEHRERTGLAAAAYMTADTPLLAAALTSAPSECSSFTVVVCQT